MAAVAASGNTPALINSTGRTLFSAARTSQPERFPGLIKVAPRLPRVRVLQSARLDEAMRKTPTGALILALGSGTGGRIVKIVQQRLAGGAALSWKKLPTFPNF
jgi:hypothetical protein